MKKVLAMVMAVWLTVCLGTTAFASSKTSQGNIHAQLVNQKTMTPASLPEGVTPIEFSTQEEADAFIAEVLENLNTPITPTQSRISTGTWTVDTTKVALWCYVDLKMKATTTGDHYTGTVRSAKAFTVFRGFTLGFEWNERACNAEIHGKDVYSWCDGTLDCYLLIKGTIKLYSFEINMDGWSFVVR